MVNVKKADGKFYPFDRNKVLRTSRRIGLSEDEAEEVVSGIEKELFEGMETKKIIRMILNRGKKHKPWFGHMIDLREALGKMRPKPDFEHFVSILLQDTGYKISMNKIVQGKCIDHEIDVIASKGNEVLYVEVKHHNKFHTFTGLGVFLEINSTFQDLLEGHAANKNKYHFTRALMVSNTKISNHASKYASCKGIETVVWDIPAHSGIGSYIHSKFLYPITILRGLDIVMHNLLGDNGIYTLKQFSEADIRKLSKIPGMNIKKLHLLVGEAQKIIDSPSS